MFDQVEMSHLVLLFGTKGLDPFFRTSNPAIRGCSSSQQAMMSATEMLSPQMKVFSPFRSQVFSICKSKFLIDLKLLL